MTIEDGDVGRLWEKVGGENESLDMPDGFFSTFLTA